MRAIALMVTCFLMAACGSGNPDTADYQCPEGSCPAVLPNASFEEGRSYDASLVEGWFASDSGTHMRRVKNATDGEWAVELYMPTDSTRVDPITFQTTNSLWSKPGATYDVGFSADVPDGLVTLTIEWRDDLNQCVADSTGKCISATLPAPELAGGYAALSTQIVAPEVSSARRLYASLVFRATLKRGGSARIDSVKFESK